MMVVAFITAAMICVMSAFNGIDDLVKSLFSNFDTPLTIVPAEGKVFSDSLIVDADLMAIEGIQGFSRVIEDDVWLSYSEQNAVATLKGVDSDYLKYSPIDSMIYEGRFLLEDDSFFYAVVGLGVRGELGMPFFENQPTVMGVNAPVRGKKISRFRENAFNREAVNVSGVFSVNAELDSRYVLVPLPFARSLFEMETKISAIEIFLENDDQAEKVKAQLEERLDPSLRIQTRFDKNALIYKTNAAEKWATFLILLFILLIACFNIIASLTMLIIEKKKDIFTLSSMGLQGKSIEAIFVFEGVLINFFGALTGAALGLSLCFLQEKFGLITMEGAMVNAYPVSIKWLDITGILLSVLLVGTLFSATLVRLLVRRFAGNAMMKVE
jgi:lipoprotein-releasing system permease protein